MELISFSRSLSSSFPNTFSKVAYQLIINPRKKLNKPSSDQLSILKKSTQVKFSYKNYTIKTYQWGSGKKRILLVHGWEGQASSFHSLIDRLNSKKYTIYAFDAINIRNAIISERHSSD